MGLLLRLLVLVCLLALLASPPARAASYQTITLEVGPSGSLVVHNETYFNLGAVSILTTGATDFTFNALPGLSLPDSVFLDVGIPPYSVLVANNTFSGVSIVPAFSQAFMGAFQISDPAGFEIFSGDEFLGGTVWDTIGNSLVPVSVFSSHPICDPGPCPDLPYNFVMTFVPEPAGLGVLGGLALAALLYTRRITSCA